MKKQIGFLLFTLMQVTTSFAQTTTISVNGLSWSAENLAVKSFANGDKIDEVKSTEDWVKAGTDSKPAWCYYDNDPANAGKYGILYNYFAVIDPRGLAPKGWRIPTKYEWIDAMNSLGGLDVAGGVMKSKTGWTAVTDVDRNGTNTTGFNATPAGLRFPDGKFDALGTYSHFWTSTPQTSVQGQAIHFGIVASVVVGHAGNPFGYSVRCVKAE